MDFLFSANKPWAWEAEKQFKLLKEQSASLVRAGSLSVESGHDAEKGATHVDSVSTERV